MNGWLGVAVEIECSLRAVSYQPMFCQLEWQFSSRGSDEETGILF